MITRDNYRDGGGTRAHRRRRFAHALERFGLLVVWLLIAAGFCIALPESFFTWTNFAVMFSSQAPAVLLALALIIPLTAHSAEQRLETRRTETPADSLERHG